MFKHTVTGIIYSNRKEACRVMGQGRYKRERIASLYLTISLKREKLPLIQFSAIKNK